MKALIDGDIVLHRCGYSSDNDPENIALVRTNVMIEEILEETRADEFEVWLSDSYDNNYRKQLAPSYKANRTQPRPVHYEAIKEFLYDEWKAYLALGMEADDAMGIEQTRLISSTLDTTSSVICSIDKDLKQIAGLHYNFVKKEWDTVQYPDGLRFFYKQLLIGDTSDNIRGVEGIGPVKAGKLLDPIKANAWAKDGYGGYEWFEKVRELYNDDERLLVNGRLLWIRRKDDEVWNFPVKPLPEAA